jgi:signal transduction histidine kinase/CheY-like chemotaxis protein
MLDAGARALSRLWYDPDPKSSRRTAIFILRIAAVAALVLPIVLFTIASWISYREYSAFADERIERSLDVIEEQALRVFQSINLALSSIEDLLGNRSPEQVEADQKQLHARLNQIMRELPEVQSIWIFGPMGYPQVITREYPAPTAIGYAEQDYFRVPRQQPGVYIGTIHQSETGGKPYFACARAHYGLDGKFAGVIELSLLPSDFSRFYARLAGSAGVQLAMFRDDGIMLARSPDVPGEQARLDERSAFHRTISQTPEGGFYTATSQIDNVTRRYGLRKMPGFPIYLAAGIETATIRSEWIKAMSLHLIFGIPATLFLFGALLAVLVRTERLYREQDRREAAEAAARQSQKMEAIGHLSGGIAHDFNNMLNAVTASYDLIQRRIAKGDYAIEKFVRGGMEAAERAAALVQRLLAFARKQPLAPEPTDGNELISAMSQLLRSTLGEQIQIETVCAGGLWRTNVDPHQLESAILNIAINARDAMPDGGKLTIETANSYLDDNYVRDNPEAEPGQYVLIAITDTGVGMSTEVARQAFDPFFTTKASGKGSGLGLSQVYGFIKQSQGHIKIYSEPGAGTTLKLYLPRLVGAAQERERYATVAPGARNSMETILVVEDDPLVRRLSTDALRELGYSVFDAGEASEALRILDEHSTIKLLFTDVVMPNVNGRKLADEALRRRPDLKVIFTTGYTPNAVVHGGVLDPGVNFLSKPFSIEQLASKVRAVLDS